MSVAESQPASIALREFEMRSRSLPLDGQMRECIELLETPELVVEDLLRSVEQIRAAAPIRGRLEMTSGTGEEKGGFFYPSRELFVQGDACSFTCLATSIDFRDPEQGAQASGGVDGVDDAESGGEDDARAIDFAAVTCESRPFPVLGFTQSAHSESAYPILLRALSSLIETTKSRRFDVLDREVYRGLLGPAPAFDLALVLWDDDVATDPRRPLCELTRDLSEVLKSALQAEARFPPVLNDLVCLRMNPKRFDARLRFVWRV